MANMNLARTTSLKALINSFSRAGSNNTPNLIGINDIPVSKYYSPPLTTVSSRINEKCSLAVSGIFERIYKSPSEKIDSGIVLTSHLVVRKSTAKAKE